MVRRAWFRLMTGQVKSPFSRDGSSPLSGLISQHWAGYQGRTYAVTEALRRMTSVPYRLPREHRNQPEPVYRSI